jgi:hypothetical protein
MDFGFEPRRTFDAIPGGMNFLHFLQKLERISKGMVILNFILIFLAISACFSARPGLFFAFVSALLNRISIRFVAICFFEFFTV